MTNMICTVADYGAVGDGTTLDTAAIQAAIDACAAAGGGRVSLPSGRVYLSGSLVIGANVELHIEAGAVLRASGDYADYAPEHDISVITGGAVVETVLPRRAFIAAYRAHGCSITGNGEIDGNAEGFVLTRGDKIHTMRAPVGGRSQYLERPFTVFLIDCESVRIDGVLIRDPAFWAVRLTGCHKSSITNIKILTDLKVPNADGIDIDRCRNVKITDCELITADDCISLKSCAGTAEFGDVSDVYIARCLMATRSGAITLGTESVGDIRNVLVEDCTVFDSHRGFAVRAREGGIISDVVFRRCSLETLTFSPDWWGHGDALHVTAFRWSEPEMLGDGNIERILHGRVSGILFEDLEVVTEAGVLVWGQLPDLISDITFRRVDLRMRSSSRWPHRIDLRPNDVVPIVERPHNGFDVVFAHDVKIDSSSLSWEFKDRSHFGALMSNVDSYISSFDLRETVVTEGSA